VGVGVGEEQAVVVRDVDAADHKRAQATEEEKQAEIHHQQQQKEEEVVRVPAGAICTKGGNPRNPARRRRQRGGGERDRYERGWKAARLREARVGRRRARCGRKEALETRVDRGLAQEMRTRPRGRPGSNGPAGSDGMGGARTRIADVAQGDMRSHGPSRPL
jgi:hypothetical protein